MENRLSINKAAELMGVSPQFIRVGLQKEKLPFGYAIRMSNKKYTYFISKQKFTEYTGIPVEEKNEKDNALD